MPLFFNFNVAVLALKVKKRLSAHVRVHELERWLLRGLLLAERPERHPKKTKQISPGLASSACGSWFLYNVSPRDEMARRYLARRFDPLQIGVEIARLRDAAHRLVATEWAQQRIRLIAAALLRQGDTHLGTR
jgi:hypothetical protein